MKVVVRVVVARRPIPSDPQPGRRRELRASGSRPPWRTPMRRHSARPTSPSARRPRAGRPTMPGPKSTAVVTFRTDGVDGDRLLVRDARRLRAIVHLERVLTRVTVVEVEEPRDQRRPLRQAPERRRQPGELDVELAIGADLEAAPRGARAERRHVPVGTVVGDARTVEAPADVREVEGTDEALGDARLREESERGIGGHHLETVAVLEPTERRGETPTAHGERPLLQEHLALRGGAPVREVDRARAEVADRRPGGSRFPGGFPARYPGAGDSARRVAAARGRRRGTGWRRSCTVRLPAAPSPRAA